MEALAKIEKLKDLVKGEYDHDDPSHDFSHILRVVKICKKIGGLESADLDILIPAALLHDIVNVPKDHPDRPKASEMAAVEAENILQSLGYGDTEIKKIVTVIIEHSFSLGREPSSIESAILQDADRLDAIGAIGIMRMVTCGSRMGCKYYNINEPIAKRRPLDDRQFTIDHLYVKLFKIAEKMNTISAQKEAIQRSQFMKGFMSQLKVEIGEPTQAADHRTIKSL